MYYLSSQNFETGNLVLNIYYKTQDGTFQLVYSIQTQYNVLPAAGEQKRTNTTWRNQK